MNQINNNHKKIEFFRSCYNKKVKSSIKNFTAYIKYMCLLKKEKILEVNKKCLEMQIETHMIQNKWYSILDEMSKFKDNKLKVFTIFNEDPRRGYSKNFVKDYESKIKNPIWITEIRRKLGNNQYKFVEDFYNDVKLMFDNCRLFNSTWSLPGLIYNFYSNSLENIFIRGINNLMTIKRKRSSSEEILKKKKKEIIYDSNFNFFPSLAERVKMRKSSVNGSIITEWRDKDFPIILKSHKIIEEKKSDELFEEKQSSIMQVVTDKGENDFVKSIDKKSPQSITHVESFTSRQISKMEEKIRKQEIENDEYSLKLKELKRLQSDKIKICKEIEVLKNDNLSMDFLLKTKKEESEKESKLMKELQEQINLDNKRKKKYKILKDKFERIKNLDKFFELNIERLKEEIKEENSKNESRKSDLEKLIKKKCFMKEYNNSINGISEFSLSKKCKGCNKDKNDSSWSGWMIGVPCGHVEICKECSERSIFKTRCQKSDCPCYDSEFIGDLRCNVPFIYMCLPRIKI